MWFSQNVHPHGTLQKQGKLVDLRANSTEFLEKKKKTSPGRSLTILTFL